MLQTNRSPRFERTRDADFKIKRDAELNIKFERELYMQRAPRLRTLYYGLKVNHPRHVATVHPLSFLIRRIVFAAVIVLMARASFIGVFLLIGTCIFMLGYALNEFQWQDSIINY